MKIWAVYEDGVIWAAFTKRADAIAFRRREFIDRPESSGIVPRIKGMPVYIGLKQAPITGSDGDLKGALYL